MKKIIMITVMLLVVSWVFGTAIYLKDSNVLYGHIRGKTDEHIILFDYSIDTFVKIEISKIESVFAEDETDITEQTFALENFRNEIDEFNLYNLESIEYSNRKNLTVSNHYRVADKIYKTKVNPGMLAISLSLIALAVDSYSEASDLSKAIDEIDNSDDSDDIDTSELKKDRTRKNVVGTICVISSIISFTASFEQVEIKASPTSVSLGYRF